MAIQPGMLQTAGVQINGKLLTDIYFNVLATGVDDALGATVRAIGPMAVDVVVYSNGAGDFVYWLTGLLYSNATGTTVTTLFYINTSHDTASIAADEMKTLGTMHIPTALPGDMVELLLYRFGTEIGDTLAAGLKVLQFVVTPL